jgi:hypothetical protein
MLYSLEKVCINTCFSFKFSFFAYGFLLDFDPNLVLMVLRRYNVIAFFIG